MGSLRIILFGYFYPCVFFVETHSGISLDHPLSCEAVVGRITQSGGVGGGTEVRISLLYTTPQCLDVEDSGDSVLLFFEPRLEHGLSDSRVLILTHPYHYPAIGEWRRIRSSPPRDKFRLWLGI